MFEDLSNYAHALFAPSPFNLIGDFYRDRNGYRTVQIFWN